MPYGSYGGQYWTRRYYPNFNDAPHERPILSCDGTERAIVILVSVLGIIAGLALLLILVR